MLRGQEDCRKGMKSRYANCSGEPWIRGKLRGLYTTDKGISIDQLERFHG